MAIKVSCPKCDTAYRVETTPTEDKKVQCKKCGEIFSTAAYAKTLDTPLPGSASSTAREIIGQTIGACRIGEKIGQGGMGTVYKAHHINLDIPVAVKILPPQFAASDKANSDRFIREARSAAKLKHQNVVGVLNVAHERGVYYIVMDYVDGKSVEKLLREQKKLPINQAIDIISQVCEALSYANENNIVHRDIKPDNVMLDSKGEVKLADLGLAKRIDEESHLTQAGSMVGTPYYMSPEQVEDSRNADHRSDIYSLGCTLYQMVCGDVPFEGSSMANILYKHVNSPVPDPTESNPEIPKSLSRVIMKMMAKQPENRYPTAKQVQDALAKVKSEKHESARLKSPHAPGRDRKRAALTPYIAGGAALICVIVVISIMVFSGKESSSPTATDQGKSVPVPAETAHEAVPKTSDEDHSLEIARIEKLFNSFSSGYTPQIHSQLISAINNLPQGQRAKFSKHLEQAAQLKYQHELADLEKEFKALKAAYAQVSKRLSVRDIDSLETRTNAFLRKTSTINPGDRDSLVPAFRLKELRKTAVALDKVRKIIAECRKHVSHSSDMRHAAEVEKKKAEALRILEGKDALDDYAGLVRDIKGIRFGIRPTLVTGFDTLAELEMLKKHLEMDGRVANGRFMGTARLDGICSLTFKGKVAGQDIDGKIFYDGTAIQAKGMTHQTNTVKGEIDHLVLYRKEH